MICRDSIVITRCYVNIKRITTILKNHQEVFFKTLIVHTAQSSILKVKNNMPTLLTLTSY